MRGRRNTKMKLQIVDLGGLRKRIRKIQKRKAGIHSHRGIKHPGKNR